VNLDSSHLDTLVVHDVPQPDEDRERLILTDAAVPLDAQLRGYFERKITQSLRNRGLEVVADATGAAVVRDGAASILGKSRRARSRVAGLRKSSRPKPDKAKSSGLACRRHGIS
jgi:hypothetical protein